VETAVCKVFCSEMGWRVVNDAMQIMGGEGYMTENGLERIFRDSRIYTIVEGANEVMQSFIFAYGGKQLAEQMLGVKGAVAWDSDEGFGANLARVMVNGVRPAVMKRAVPLGAELFLGLKPSAPKLTRLHGSLTAQGERMASLVRDHSHVFKQASKKHEEAIIDRQTVQARIGDAAMWLHAMACTLSKLDQQIRSGEDGPEFERDRAAAEHFLDLAELEIRACFRGLDENADDSMRVATRAAIAVNDSRPNSDYVIHERSPVAAGEGRAVQQDHVRQFPGDGSRGGVQANA